MQLDMQLILPKARFSMFLIISLIGHRLTEIHLTFLGQLSSLPEGYWHLHRIRSVQQRRVTPKVKHRSNEDSKSYQRRQKARYFLQLYLQIFQESSRL